MGPRFQLIFILIVASALLTANALDTGKEVPILEPIKDLNDSYVIGIANYAVTEYNRQSSKSLKLDSIKEGQMQVGAGINYRLIVAAVDGTATKQYEAVVYDQPWRLYRNLTSFKPLFN